jgi:hypothetical protein
MLLGMSLLREDEKEEEDVDDDANEELWPVAGIASALAAFALAVAASATLAASLLAAAAAALAALAALAMPLRRKGEASNCVQPTIASLATVLLAQTSRRTSRAAPGRSVPGK